MLQHLQQYLPRRWTSEKEETVESCSQEYRDLVDEIDAAFICNASQISSIRRIQDVFSYGQFLIRSQLLAVSEPNCYYTVRRFLLINQSDVDQAIKYNLDYRRCNSLSELRFRRRINYYHGKVLVIVKVVTKNPDDEAIIPNTFLEYYIEYIVSFSF